MPRYINAEKIEWHTLYFNGGKQEITYKDEIDALPAEEVAPVVHAHWLKLTSDGHVLGCSNCKYEIYNDIYYPGHLQKYCQECGAKMDGEEESDG